MESLNCYFKIQYADQTDTTTGAEEIPMVIELIPSAPYLDQILARKLDAEL